ncbi:MAG: glycosyltransferase [Leptolyngbya sp. SIO4C1]|nr:glycosyltransferase [Leptolyngbya sp. SIO4C1]
MLATTTMDACSWVSAIALLALFYQLPAVALWLSRLLQGPSRRPPVQPVAAGEQKSPNSGAITIVVPTLNEAARIGPCLAGLRQQGDDVREILIVDSESQDGTREQVKAVAAQDSRFQLLSDAPLPPGWIGRPWALHTGFLNSSPHSHWILGIDADTQPAPQLAASLASAADAAGYDLVSLSPRFILKTWPECWLQPALLMTLLYRFGPVGQPPLTAERVMANGQCFLCRRQLLRSLNGYTAARSSFCDDVTLARQAALQGAKVGFWDGAELLDVRMYEGFWETWQEWGRSLDLKDASSRSQLWSDIWLLSAVQALPWLLLPLGFGAIYTNLVSPMVWWLLSVNGSLIVIRVALLAALRPSYRLEAGGWAFWLSPLADPLATLRIVLSALQRPTQWRGRIYATSVADR